MSYQFVNPTDLTTIPGNLGQVIADSELWSRQTGAEVSFARARADPDSELSRELARTAFYTANVSLFMKSGRQLLAGIGGRVAFDVVYGTDTEAAKQELLSTGFYPLPANKRDVINTSLLGSGEVVFVDFNAIKLKTDGGYGHFVVRTKVYEKDVTPAREPFVTAGFGQGTVRQKVMAYLADNSVRSVDETRIYLPSSEVVEDTLSRLADGEMVARACWLYHLDYDSNFKADIMFVGNHLALRGVRRVIAAEGGTQKSDNGSLDALAGKH